MSQGRLFVRVQNEYINADDISRIEIKDDEKFPATVYLRAGYSVEVLGKEELAEICKSLRINQPLPQESSDLSKVKVTRGKSRPLSDVDLRFKK